MSSSSLNTSFVLGVNAAKQRRLGICSTEVIEKSIDLLFRQRYGLYGAVQKTCAKNTEML